MMDRQDSRRGLPPPSANAQPTTSSRFRRDLAELGRQLRAVIGHRVDGFAADRVEADARRLEAIRSLRHFARVYFPHYVSDSESLLHTWLFERLPLLGAGAGRGCRLAVAAPRGEAKSTLITQIFALWRLLTGRSRFILIVMDAQHQAATMLEAIKAELEVNPRLKRDFPDRCGAGNVWRANVLVSRGGVKIQAAGSGARLRGLRHGAARPDLVICDDLENDERVRMRTQRDKLENWLKKTVLRLGPPDGSMDLILVGTVLHHDSVLARLLADGAWESRRFQAIVRWPDDMTAWERWREMLLVEGETSADAFYRERRASMEAGAIVSWPGMRSLESLMKIRVRDGADAFDAELQNQPMQENAPFAALHFWNGEPGAWLCFGAVDPSLGKSGGRGDPSAILVGGYDPASGVLHLLEADIRRRSPDRIIADVIALQARHGCRAWVVETVQFQEFFKDELVKRSAQAGVPVPARGVKPTRDKGLRIGALQPHVANGLIRFRREQTVLLDQLRHWGEPDAHDDGPDALEMLWRAARDGAGTVGEFHALGVPRVGWESLERLDAGLGAEGFGSLPGGVGWHGF